MRAAPHWRRAARLPLLLAGLRLPLGQLLLSPLGARGRFLLLCPPGGDSLPQSLGAALGERLIDPGSCETRLAQLSEALLPPFPCPVLGRPGLRFLAGLLPAALLRARFLALALGLLVGTLLEPLVPPPLCALGVAPGTEGLGRVHRRSSRAVAVVAARLAPSASRSPAEASALAVIAFTSQISARVAVR